METNKKYFNRLAGGAMLLAGAMAFAACSSDEDFADAVNPGAGATGETVKTQFSISVPYAAPNKRLAGSTVQAGTATFRGMKNMRLVPVEVGITPTQTDATPVAATDAPNGNVITLALQTTDLTNISGTTDSYKVYNDVEIPQNTNAFLFYGEGGTEAETDYRQYGALVPSYYSATNPWNTGSKFNTIEFALQSIYENAPADEQAKKDLLTTILNEVASATGTTGNNTAWSATADGSDLRAYYDSFVKLKAGSSNSIRLTLQDLYNSMKDANVDDIDGLKDVIVDIIEKYFEVDGAASPNNTLAWDDAKTADPDYPGCYNLPDGAVWVKADNGKFTYQSGNPDGISMPALTNYVYPTSLYYYANTALKTATTPQQNNYATQTSWADCVGLYKEGFSVAPNTQAVVLCSPIQYAVGSLEIKARFNGELEDNGDNWPEVGAGTGTVVTTPTAGFPLTGVMIGGQKNATWNFTPNDGATEVTIYDSYIGDNGAGVNITTTAPSTSNVYTLALETKGAESGQTETVRFALEFTNTSGQAFVGNDGIVPVGGKFYLVGELVSDENSGDLTNKHIKVFEQDHTTTANVTITSLQHAYNCIPDLRTPKLELGLAVNLEWQKGLEANVTID